MVLRFVYLDGSEQVGFLLAEVEETSNGYPIGQKIDEGHVVDQVVHLSDAQDDDGGEALRETEKLSFRLNLRHISTEQTELRAQYSRRAAGPGSGCSSPGGS